MLELSNFPFACWMFSSIKRMIGPANKGVSKITLGDEGLVHTHCCLLDTADSFHTLRTQPPFAFGADPIRIAPARRRSFLSLLHKRRSAATIPDHHVWAWLRNRSRKSKQQRRDFATAAPAVVVWVDQSFQRDECSVACCCGENSFDVSQTPRLVNF
jgi:hypothetical protein